MNTYIGIEGNKLRMKPEMKKPEYRHGSKKYDQDLKTYQSLLSSLPVIKAEFEVEVGREYVEGVDFKRSTRFGDLVKENEFSVCTGKNNIGVDLWWKKKEVLIALPISKIEERERSVVDGLIAKGFPRLEEAVTKEAKQFAVIEVSGIVTGVGFEEVTDCGTYSEIICETLLDGNAEESKKWAKVICDALNRDTPSPSPTIKSAEEVLDDHIGQPGAYAKEEYNWILSAMIEYASQFRDKPSK